MKILFNEQDLIDSACVLAADRYNENIQDLEAELHHEEGKGISAIANFQNGREVHQFTEQDVIDGSAMYLEKYHNFDPNQLTIELLFEEEQGFSAIIEKG
jgi:hypothetical protein